jgi:hypothetical protein
MKALTKHAIDEYVSKGVPPGSFLTAVLQNNLRDSLGTADLENRHDLFEIVSYIYNECPSTCWGSPQKVRDWLKSFKEKV